MVRLDLTSSRACGEHETQKPMNHHFLPVNVTTPSLDTQYSFSLFMTDICGIILCRNDSFILLQSWFVAVPEQNRRSGSISLPVDQATTLQNWSLLISTQCRSISVMSCKHRLHRIISQDQAPQLLSHQLQDLRPRCETTGSHLIQVLSCVVADDLSDRKWRLLSSGSVFSRWGSSYCGTLHPWIQLQDLFFHKEAKRT